MTQPLHNMEADVLQSRSHVFADTTVRYLHGGRGPALVFLQGFGINPTHYRPLLNTLAQHFEVIAPDLLRPGRFRGQPSAIGEFASAVDDLCRSLGVQEPGVVGHSLGGAVSYTLGANTDVPRWIVGLNPVLPANCGPTGFLTRSLHKGARESVGREGLRGVLFANRFHPSFVYNCLRDLRTTAKIAADVCQFDYRKLDVPQPSLMLFGDRDEYFHLSPLVRRQIEQAFTAITIKPLPGLNHDWPVFRPERGAEEIQRFATD